MILVIKKICQSLVNAKTYINSELEFGRNTSLWKEWHRNTLYQKIFYIETPWNQSGYNYCYFRGNNISPLVLLLPLPARWRWTRAVMSTNIRIFEYSNKMALEYYSYSYSCHFPSTNIFGYSFVDFWTAEYIRIFIRKFSKIWIYLNIWY